MDKKEIANILNDIGLLLELKGENPLNRELIIMLQGQ